MDLGQIIDGVASDMETFACVVLGNAPGIALAHAITGTPMCNGPSSVGAVLGLLPRRRLIAASG